MTDSKNGFYLDYRALGTPGNDNIFTPEPPTPEEVYMFCMRSEFCMRTEVDTIITTYRRYNSKGLWHLIYNLGLHDDQAVKEICRFDKNDENFKTPSHKLLELYLEALENLAEKGYTDASFAEFKQSIESIMLSASETEESIRTTLLFLKILDKLSINAPYIRPLCYTWVTQSDAIDRLYRIATLKMGMEVKDSIFKALPDNLAREQ
jgi:hypothetical protein